MGGQAILVISGGCNTYQVLLSIWIELSIYPICFIFLLRFIHLWSSDTTLHSDVFYIFSVCALKFNTTLIASLYLEDITQMREHQHMIN